MPAARIDEPSEVGQASALEVKHPNRGVCAFCVLLDQRVPTAAMWTTEFVSGLKRSRVHAADRGCYG